MGCQGSKTAAATKAEEKPVAGTTLLEEPTAEAKSAKANEGTVAAAVPETSVTEGAHADASVSAMESPADALAAESAGKDSPPEVPVADANKCTANENAGDQGRDSMTTQNGVAKEVEIWDESVPALAPALKELVAQPSGEGKAVEELVAQPSGDSKAAATEVTASLLESSVAPNAVFLSPSLTKDIDPEAEVARVNRIPAGSQFWCLHCCFAASGMESQAEIVVEK